MVLKKLFYGNAVTGDERFSRPALEDRFMRALTSSSGIKMFGLRRIGKSTMRLYASECFEREGRAFAYIDGQGLHSLNDLISKLFQAMPPSEGFMNRALSIVTAGPVQSALQALAEGLELEETVTSAHWRLVSEAIRKAIRGNKVKPVLIIDEFSYLIKNMAEKDEVIGSGDADKLLASMREWRSEGMTMLLTGSIGLTRLARKHNLNLEHLNDLQPFSIPELTEKEAREFIKQATSKSEGKWSDEHTECFLKETGVLYPCFLVLGLLEINVSNPADIKDFPSIFADHVRPNLHNDFYNQFVARFKDYGDLDRGEREGLIIPALSQIMNSGEACSQDDITCSDPFTQVDLALALDMLADDGFICFSESKDGLRLWKPASRLTKLWWQRMKFT